MCHILRANSVHQNIINLLQQKYQPFTKSPFAFNIPWLSCVKLNNVTSSREWAMMYMVYHFQVKASKMLPPLLNSSASVRYILFLSFIVLIFA